MISRLTNKVLKCILFFKKGQCNKVVKCSLSTQTAEPFGCLEKKNYSGQIHSLHMVLSSPKLKVQIPGWKSSK